jgi:alpha-ketoglutarate-dependent taurine dioxygenase
MRSLDAAPHSLSAVHGLGTFPFHTDAAHHKVPPRWLLLRCIDPGDSDRATLIIDSHDLVLDHEELREVGRAVWNVHTGFKSFLASALVRCLNVRNTVMRLRYDPGCMTIADPSFADAAALLRDSLGKVPPSAIDWEPNHTLVVDNWRVLHARGDAKVDDAGRRHLQRVLSKGSSR